MRIDYVYIMSSHSRRLYIGSSSDLARRVAQHRSGVVGGHTAAYQIDKLVYYEHTVDARAAVTRERQLKGWVREKKRRLVEAQNPEWRDLAESFLGQHRPDTDAIRPAQ